MSLYAPPARQDHRAICRAIFAYNTIDGLYYELQQDFWIPVAAPAGQGKIMPVNSSLLSPVPISDSPNDPFVIVHDTLFTGIDMQLSYVNSLQANQGDVRDASAISHGTSHPASYPASEFERMFDDGVEFRGSEWVEGSQWVRGYQQGDQQQHPYPEAASTKFRAPSSSAHGDGLTSTGLQFHGSGGEYSSTSIQQSQRQMHAHPQPQASTQSSGRSEHDHMAHSSAYTNEPYVDRSRDYQHDLPSPPVASSSRSPSHSHSRQASASSSNLEYSASLELQREDWELARMVVPPIAPSPPGSTSTSQSVLKLARAKKYTEKKQTLACLFCRERKIACGRPKLGSADRTCNQCARRRLTCEYPTESRRGQHKRLLRRVNNAQ